MRHHFLLCAALALSLTAASAEQSAPLTLSFRIEAAPATDAAPESPAEPASESRASREASASPSPGQPQRPAETPSPDSFSSPAVPVVPGEEAILSLIQPLPYPEWFAYADNVELGVTVKVTATPAADGTITFHGALNLASTAPNPESPTDTGGEFPTILAVTRFFKGTAKPGQPFTIPFVSLDGTPANLLLTFAPR